ncbi:MAG: T9SS type A sorting domain-containing protein [Bacteroidia bacterium]
MKRKLLTGAALMASVFAMNAQDACSTALELPEGVTTVEELYGEYLAEVCWNPPTQANDPEADAANWYYIVAPADGMFRINTNLPQNAGGDTRISVYSGDSCDALTCWSASDDTYYGATAAESNFLTNFEFPVQAGDTYYIAFDNRWDGSGFDVEATFTEFTACSTSVPFSESWGPSSAEYWFCWSKINNNQDNYGFSLYTDYDFGGEDANFDNVVGVFSTNAELDEFLLSNGKPLVAGVSYTLGITYSTFSPSATVVANESFEAVVVTTAGYTPIGEELELAATSETQEEVINNAVTSTYEFTPNADGNYRVGVHATSAQGGGGLFILNIWLTETASTGKTDANAFSVYPNPSNSIVNIANAKAQINGVKLTDINGRTVKAASFDGVSTAQVNIADLSAGVYMMTINSDKGAVTKKVVKN